MSEFEQIHDSEPFEVESEKVIRFACCDCGLVHDVAFATADGKPVGVAMRRNSDATKARRAVKAQKDQRPEAFAQWCVDMLTECQSRGLHLDQDKLEILTRARAALGLEAA